MAKNVTRTFTVDVLDIKYFDGELEQVVSSRLEVPDATSEKDWEKHFKTVFPEDCKLVKTTFVEQKEVTTSMPKSEFYAKAVKTVVEKEEE